jgi:hypothetical protein
MNFDEVGTSSAACFAEDLKRCLWNHLVVRQPGNKLLSNHRPRLDASGSAFLKESLILSDMRAQLSMYLSLMMRFFYG